MRKLILSGAVAMLTLVLAGVATATLTQISKITLTATRAGQPTGVRLHVQSIDAGAPQPAAMTRVTISFPKGTRFDLNTSRLRKCAVPDKQLRDQFGRKCPKGSLIASGKGSLNTFPLPSGLTKTPNEVPVTVTAYLGRANIILVLKPTVTAYKSMITVLHATVSGATLTVKLPKLMWGADKKAQPPFPGVRVVVVLLRLSVPAVGRGSNALITSGRCTARKFVVTSVFTYADGKRLTRKSSSACR